ncbi:MAG TPA: elongation factor P [Anaerolineae bacterium]|nr:elongation factor P [Anaerolineae bacterium]
MIDVNQLRSGITFLDGDDLLKVTDYSHSKPGRGKATIRVTVRNVRTGANFQKTFTSGDRVEDVRLEKHSFQYLYDDGQFFVFMNTGDYSQKQVRYETFGDDKYYLKDNLDLELLLYGQEVVDYNLPPNVDLEVTEAENAVAGDTATGATKQVVLETGLRTKTPLFVNTGDVIRVSTTTGEYVTRV